MRLLVNLLVFNIFLMDFTLYKNLRVLFIFISLCVFSLSAAFETPETEARAKAMGNAVVSKAIGGSTTIYNPALLSSFSEDIFLGFSVFPRSRGVSDGSVIQASASAIVPFKRFVGKDLGGLGVSFNGLFTLVNGEAIYNEYELAVGYGFSMGSYVEIGANLLLQASSFPTADVDVDPTINSSLGVVYRVNDSFKMALVGLNLIGMNIASESSIEEENVAREMRYGVNYDESKYSLVGDVAYKFGINEHAIRIGGEYYFSKKKYTVGSGLELINLSQAINLSLGFSLNLNDTYEIGYGFSYPIVSAGGFGDHVVTVSFRI